MGKREHKTNREAERKPESPGRKARKVEKNNRRSNKNKSTSCNVREVEGRRAKIKGIKKQEQRMWIKKMSPSSTIHREATCHADGRTTKDDRRKEG